MLSYKTIIILGLLLFTYGISVAQDSLNVKSTVQSNDQRNSDFYSFSVGLIANRNAGENRYGISIMGVMGVEIYNSLKLGFGLGYEDESQLNTMPFFFQVSGDLKDKVNSPYYYSNIGKSRVWVGDLESGQVSDANFLEIGIGYKWTITDYKLMIGMGWKYQKFTVTQDDQSMYLVPELSFTAPPAFKQITHWEQQRITLRMGIEF